MPYLTVPGAELYYEVVGRGPLLVTISGANGSADLWRDFATQLSSSFTVCMYDRRGFSRSYLTGSQDYTQRLETDADDVAALIRHLSPAGNEPAPTATATVLGNSSGAIVALMVLTRHPDLLRTLLPHEPPLFKLLPQDIQDTLIPRVREAHTIYRHHGPVPALEAFADFANFHGEERAGLLSAFNPRNGPYIAQNTMYWFEREFLPYPLHEFDLELLKTPTGKEKLMLVNGRDSDRQAPAFVPNVRLAEKLGGLEVHEFSGMHLGFASHPEDFARELVEALKQRGGL